MAAFGPSALSGPLHTAAAGAHSFFPVPLSLSTARPHPCLLRWACCAPSLPVSLLVLHRHCLWLDTSHNRRAADCSSGAPFCGLGGPVGTGLGGTPRLLHARPGGHTPTGRQRPSCPWAHRCCLASHQYPAFLAHWSQAGASWAAPASDCLSPVSRAGIQGPCAAHPALPALSLKTPPLSNTPAPVCVSGLFIGVFSFYCSTLLVICHFFFNKLWIVRK